MEQNETQSQTQSLKSRLDRFGEKIHTFTDEEREKGRQNISPRRKIANSLNPFKTGNYSNRERDIYEIERGVRIRNRPEVAADESGWAEVAFIVRVKSERGERSKHKRNKKYYYKPVLQHFE